jgi:hypothetical protein
MLSFLLSIDALFAAHFHMSMEHCHFYIFAAAGALVTTRAGMLHRRINATATIGFV